MSAAIGCRRRGGGHLAGQREAGLADLEGVAAPSEMRQVSNYTTHCPEVTQSLAPDTVPAPLPASAWPWVCFIHSFNKHLWNPFYLLFSSCAPVITWL